MLEPAGSEDAEAPLARSRVRPDLSKLHQSFVNLPRRDAETAYTSAARAVRRLIGQRGARAIVALLQDLGQGTPFASAFQHRIEMRYKDFAALPRGQSSSLITDRESRILASLNRRILQS